jgi:hypothetical protein
MMLEELQRRHYSEATTLRYIRFIERFAQHFHRSPDRLGPQHIREYQAQLFTSRDEFLRRFLLHLLPKGFVRIRHFGFLANRKRATLLPRCFTALHVTPPKHESKTSTAPTTQLLWRCPKCGGPMAVVERITVAQLQLRSPPLLATAA